MNATGFGLRFGRFHALRVYSGAATLANQTLSRRRENVVALELARCMVKPERGLQMSTPAPRDRSGRWQMITAILGSITAAVGLVAAVLTLGLGGGGGAPAPSTAPEPSAVTPTTPMTPTSGQVPASSPVAYTTRNSDPGFTITVGDSFDLDVLPSGTPETGDRVADISMDAEGLAISPLAQVTFLGTAVEANYSTCHDANGYVAGDKTGTGMLPEGSFLCLKTSGKRFVAMRLIHVDSSSWTFDTVTYDPPK
jgi:hypothetical protein